MPRLLVKELEAAKSYKAKQSSAGFDKRKKRGGGAILDRWSSVGDGRSDSEELHECPCGACAYDDSLVGSLASARGCEMATKMFVLSGACLAG